MYMSYYLPIGTVQK